MNCNTPTDIVFSFTGFALRGGGVDEHQDGWGIAFFEGKGVRHLVDYEAAIHSPLAELVKSHPIKSKHVIAHIRRATQGKVSLENCHPFVRECWGKNWVFAHNGDLKAFAPHLSGMYLPVGNTDSEVAFCFILQKLREEYQWVEPTVDKLQHSLKKICAEINQFGTFNMMLSQGEALFVYCSTQLHYLIRQFPFDVAQLSDQDMSIDFATVTTPRDRVAVIATTPLTKNEMWTALAPGELTTFVEGAIYAVSA